MAETTAKAVRAQTARPVKVRGALSRVKLRRSVTARGVYCGKDNCNLYLDRENMIDLAHLLLTAARGYERATVTGWSANSSVTILGDKAR